MAERRARKLGPRAWADRTATRLMARYMGSRNVLDWYPDEHELRCRIARALMLAMRRGRAAEGGRDG